MQYSPPAILSLLVMLSLYAWKLFVMLMMNWLIRNLSSADIDFHQWRLLEYFGQSVLGRKDSTDSSSQWRQHHSSFCWRHATKVAGQGDCGRHFCESHVLPIYESMTFHELLGMHSTQASANPIPTQRFSVSSSKSCPGSAHNFHTLLKYLQNMRWHHQLSSLHCR